LVSLKDIRALARQIGREFRPQKVILFGSYARGTPTEDSDVDLLVVMPFEGKPVYKAAEILFKTNPVFALDIIVRSPQAVRERLALQDGFVEEIFREGKVLYEDGYRGVGGQGRGGLRGRRARVAGPKTRRV
jgi:predicted nucleotidyltransferase